MKKIRSVKQLSDLWQAYKDECDNQMVLTYEFSSKSSEFISEKLRRSVTYTMEGFCVFIGISRSAFYKKFGGDERFADMIARMKEECEVDARKKLELQVIPLRLAGMCIGNSGEKSGDGQTVPVVISGADGLED